VRLRLAALFVALFANFLVWALIKPIFQAPDEFAHLTKALSVPAQPWVSPTFKVEVHEHFYNPLLDTPYLHEVPFHPKRKFSVETIDELQATRWSKRGDWSKEHHRTTSFMYPNLYFGLVFALGQAATELLSLSPYDSVYAFRIASSAFSAALWTVVFVALRCLGRYRTPVFALLVLQPMLDFMSSSIHPDALALPLSALVAITAYDAILLGRGLGAAVACLLALLFAKSNAVVVFPVLATLATAVWGLRRAGLTELRVHWRNTAVLVLGCFVLFHLSFYYWSPMVILWYGFEESLLSYLNHLVFRIPGLFIGYWGGFGWLDYTAPRWVYLVILGLLLANAAALGWSWRKRDGDPRYAALLAFSALYAGALVAAEFVYVPRAGYALQGRHFLPAALGLLVVVCHHAAWLRRAFVAFLVVFNVYCLQLTVDRYYAGDWSLVRRALPFRGADGSGMGPRRPPSHDGARSSPRTSTA
jgi:hypothetical protein